MATMREEDYLEAIASVVGKKGYAKVNDISKLLGVAPSSVTEMFRRLSDSGYVNYEKYSGVTLKKKGEELAAAVQSRHDVLKEFLILLGVEESIADEDACKIEHDLNQESLERLSSFVEFLKDPTEGQCIKKFRKKLD